MSTKTTLCAQLSEKGCRRDPDGVLRCEVKVGSTFFEMSHGPNGLPSFEKTRGPRVLRETYLDMKRFARQHINSFLRKEESVEIVGQSVVLLAEYHNFAERHHVVPPSLRGPGRRSGESTDG